MYKIRPRYPASHEYLRTIYSVLRFTIRLSSRPQVYRELISEGLAKMKEHGDLEKKASPDAVQSFLYAITIANIENVVQKYKLNDLMEELSTLNEGILEIYRSMSHYRLWTLSKEERSISASKYNKDTVSATLKAIVDLNASKLGSKYGDLSNCVGRTELLLQPSEQDD